MDDKESNSEAASVALNGNGQQFSNGWPFSSYAIEFNSSIKLDLMVINAIKLALEELLSNC